MRGIKRGDGRATLTLEGGLAVPVSRRHARALRAAGWYSACGCQLTTPGGR